MQWSYSLPEIIFFRSGNGDRIMGSLRREAMDENRCRHCHNIFLPNTRIKNQQYCNCLECQRDRKAFWQKQKMHQDLDYKANQKDAWENWRTRNPGYWENYRRQHPQYRERNRLLQRVRNTKRSVRIAKMDTLTHCLSYQPGLYYLVPPIAKMDALAQKVFIIPAPYTVSP
jgi:hypothetical protein